MPTSSQLVERLGAVEPQILHHPPGVVSLAAAEEAIELADAYGLCDGYPLAESQKVTLRAALGERADGSWAASRVADFGPRQGTGKSDKIAARELAGVVLFGEKLIIHTAHEFPTANESFLRLAGLFENWDDLSRMVEHIYYGNGAQAIHLKGGRRILYKARTVGSGRGFAKADLVVYDEAQHLGREHVAASGPTKMANPNAQTWYAGSGGLSTSQKAWEIRRQALLGTGGRLAYTEMTGETITVVDGKVRTVVPDPLDRDVWYRTIPGLGRWVTEEAVEGLFDELGEESFLREILCVWDPEPGSDTDPVLDSVRWQACESDEPSDGPPRVFAVDVSPNQMSAAVSAAGSVKGVPSAQVLESHPGTGWVVPALLALRADHPNARFVAPAAPAPSGSLFGEAKAAGLDLEPVSASAHAAACSSLEAQVNESRMRHRRDELLDAALSGATKKDVGDGAWVWSRKSSLVDITPLVSFTLALAAVGEPGEVEDNIW